MKILNLLSLDKWTRLADVVSHAESSAFLTKSLYCLNDGVYLQVSPFKAAEFTESAEAPFLTGILFAPDDSAAKRVGALTIEEDRGLLLEISADVLPQFLVLQYGEIKEVLKNMKPKVLQEAAIYRLATDGKFVHRTIETELHTFYFRGMHNDSQERPYAVLYKLAVSGRK